MVKRVACCFVAQSNADWEHEINMWDSVYRILYACVAARYCLSGSRPTLALSRPEPLPQPQPQPFYDSDSNNNKK